MTHAYRHMDVRDCGDDRATWSLLAENAQLRRLCAQSKDLVARHELALREGDHRIKNSLQIVASLMGAQERRETNPAARQALRTATSRIQAVARIHDALQLTGGADDVSLGALIETMCTSLHAMAGDSDAVRIIVDAECIHAPIRLAQPVVLVTNELVVNALRHAFPEGRPGAIQVSVSSSGGQFCALLSPTMVWGCRWIISRDSVSA